MDYVWGRSGVRLVPSLSGNTLIQGIQKTCSEWSVELNIPNQKHGAMPFHAVIAPAFGPRSRVVVTRGWMYVIMCDEPGASSGTVASRNGSYTDTMILIWDLI